MEMDELRRRVGIILAVEERETVNWHEVEHLARDLQSNIHIDATPEIVHHYLDDADIRARDEVYAVQQRRQIRRFVEAGDCDDGTALPLWGCALLLLTAAGLVLWLAM